ncbi:hypothetical protein POM88_042754 [Heracleum sosnowskyi]|uniref:F-box domain-containing protein n=1 Tax=Heracleum sosnowskyi TaxID=360622 RepID=A0AAD8HIA6_9APIA|nr:hypothetical protein POM88_042754 [Heracleum sosnowskyi]
MLKKLEKSETKKTELPMLKKLEKSETKKTELPMLKKLEKSETKKTELPEKIIYTHILPRLPILSVIRFKTVSKSWYAVLSSPKFLKEHSAALSLADDCLIVHKYKSFIAGTPSPKFVVLTPDPCRELTIKSYPNNFIPGDLIGSVDGLVGLRCRDKFWLWNPALRKSLELTLPQNISSCLSEVGLCVENLTQSGISFDHGSSDFKVVVCFVGLPPKTTYGLVYSCKRALWERIRVPTDIDCDNYPQTGPVAFIRDCPYWKTISIDDGLGNDDRLGFGATKFQPDKREFISLPYFRPHQKTDPRIHYQFVNMKDSLTLFAHDCLEIESPKMDVYCLENNVWTKIYRITLPEHHRSIKSFYMWCPSQGFQYRDELVVYEQDGKYYCYNQKSKEIKPFRSKMSDISSNLLCICYRYNPTLRLLPGMESINE